MNYSFDDFFYFYLVVKHGGFSTASEATSISKSKLSRHVADLEQHFKIQLIQRTTRSFKVTAIGHALYEQCRKIMNQIHVAENLLLTQNQSLKGTIRVVAHPLILKSKIPLIFDLFMQQHPEVKIKIELTQSVQELGYDSIHIRLLPHLEHYKHPNTTIKDLFQTPFCLVVTPDLITNTTIKHPYDLYKLPRIYTTNNNTITPWKLSNNHACISIDTPLEPYLVTEDYVNAYYSASNGLGVANLPYLMVEKDLKSGNLVQVLSQWDSGLANIQVIYLEQNAESVVTEQLIKALVYDFNPLENFKKYDEIA